jgi:hypothetical protein
LEHKTEYSHNKPSSSNFQTQTRDKPENNTENSEKKKNSNLLNCRFCQARFVTYRELYEHRLMYHKQTGNGTWQGDPWSESEHIAPRVNKDGSENESMRKEYDLHRHLIFRERVQEGNVRNRYNFLVPNLLNVQQLMDQIDFIYANNFNAFKLNFAKH